MKVVNVENVTVEESGIDVLSWGVYIIFTKQEIDEILSRYDSGSGTSPFVGDTRPTMRAILNKIIEHG